jgi:hypothetical protein
MTDYIPDERTACSAPSTPHSREAEEAVVGAVLINPEVYFDVAQFLAAEDFYIHRHRWIWEAFTSLHEHGYLLYAYGHRTGWKSQLADWRPVTTLINSSRLH